MLPVAHTTNKNGTTSKRQGNFVEQRMGSPSANDGPTGQTLKGP